MSLSPEQQGQLRQAGQAFQQGDYRRAHAISLELLRQAGMRSDVLNLLAMSELAMSGPEAAARHLDAALKLEPASAILHINRATAAEKMCRYKLAQRHASDAIRLASQNPSILYQAARLQRLCRNHAGALRTIEHCLKVKTDFADAWHIKAGIHADLGDFAASETALEKVIQLEQRHAGAISSLASQRGEKALDGEVFGWLQNIIRAPRNASDQACAAFAMADLYRRNQQHDMAFDWYRQANDIIGKLRPFDIDAWQQTNQATLQQYQELTAISGTGGGKLVFVLGMPRSGSSLVEQVLSGHDAIMGCGEMGAMNYLQGRHQRLNPSASGFSDIQAGELKAYRQAYLAALPAGHEQHGVLIDKSPQNFERIGFIHQLFPDARFIHTTRDPLDTIISCYFQDFQRGLNWAFNLQSITRVYIAQAQLMAYWKARLPDRILEVNYEALVDDLSAGAMAMADFLGVELQDAMLEPHKTERAVVTASVRQVRQPVYRSSMQRWKHYENQLQGVIAMLDSAGLLPKPG